MYSASSAFVAIFVLNLLIASSLELLQEILIKNYENKITKNKLLILFTVFD